jgi:hypothetical protein|tara:strand:- start:78 stop:818 length:741 start_codon:yes stop_codon:yes gene_type:complete
MKKRIIKRIFKDAPGSSDTESFGFGCGSILWLILAIVLIFYPAAQDPDLYLMEAVVMGSVFFFRWLYLLSKKNRKINELKSLNNFVFNQLQANSYFSEYNDINSYFNKHILKPRRNYITFYKNEVPLSHIENILFINNYLEKENTNWELSDPYNCQIQTALSYEIIGEFQLSSHVSYDLNGGGLRYVDLKKGRRYAYTPWYRQLFPRRVDDNIMYALKKRHDNEQKNKIILISKNELCLFNIIYES